MSTVNNYTYSENIHNTTAAEEFLHIIQRHVQPQSVVDVGCGLGTWLKVFEESGLKNILGIDGNYIEKSNLKISEKNFLLHDLSTPLNYNRRFDLAICLEVAEHLPESASEIIIDTLTGLADTILFSAALPNQGGQNHINEQSFSYWVQKFNKKGYIVKDIFRNEIWLNEKIDWWYKQNMFLIIKSDGHQQIINDFYHPVRYNQIINELELYQIQAANFYSGNITLKQAIKTLFKTILKIGK